MSRPLIDMFELAWKRLGVPHGLVYEMVERGVIQIRGQQFFRRVWLFHETDVEAARRWLSDNKLLPKDEVSSDVQAETEVEHA